MGQQLFKYFKDHDNENGKDSEILSSDTFIKQSMEMLGLITDGEQLEFFIKVSVYYFFSRTSVNNFNW